MDNNDILADFENTKAQLSKTQAALKRANRYGMQTDEENRKLRDLILRMLPIVQCVRDYHANWIEADKKLGLEPSDMFMRIVNSLDPIIHEAKEVAG